MALNFGIEPPRWLSDSAAWYRESGERSTNALTQSIFQGAKLGMEREQHTLNMASGLLQLQGQEEALSLNKMKTKALSQDMNAIPKWLQEHPTWESRQDSQWPTALTPEFDKRLNEIRVTDARSVQAKAATEAVGAFSKRVNELSKSDPLAAGQFAPYVGKANPSPTILQALSVAEETAKVSAQNKKDLAALEAERRGDLATTTITDKGITTSYKPKPPAPADATPKTMTLDGGSVLAWVPGGKTLHVINGKKKTELTPNQLQNISKGLPDDDPHKKQISDFLANSAMEQVAPKSKTNAPSTTDPLGLFK